jgi:hypothetical protein
LKNLTLILIIALLLASFTASLFYNEWKQAKKDISDLKEIISVQEKKSEAIRFKDKDGLEHVKTEVTTIHDPRNLKQDPELRKILERMEGKIKNLELLSSTHSVNNTSFLFTLKDSIIHDTIQVKCLDWTDHKWTTIQACEGDTGRLVIYDTIHETIYRERNPVPRIRIGNSEIKGPRIGKQKVYSEIVNRNPNTKIITHTTYKVKK